MIILQLIVALQGLAQSTFDVATFSPPRGWERAEQNGMVSLTTRGTAGRRPTYCQIFMFPSHPASADPQQNFVAEWSRLIVQSFGTNAAPQLASTRTPEGWAIVMGTVNLVQRGIPVTAILVTATGADRAMSIVVNVTAQDFAPEVRAFLESLRFSVPVAAAAPNVTGSAGDYAYKIPEGWTGTTYPDGGIVYASPVYETGERCQLSIFPMRRASGSRDLLTDARQAFVDIFGVDPFQDNGYPFPEAKLSRGIAAAGWTYLVIQKSLHGRVGDATLLGTRLFAAQLDDNVAIITGTGKEPLVSQCFGELVRDEWPRFFFSISFKNWKPVAQEQRMQQQLAGAWVTATASAADRYVFAANGRFASAAAARTVSRISATELLVTTNAYFGDGSYRITGNTITLTLDRGRVDRGYLRLEQDSQDGVNWKDRLCLLLEGIGEVCYKRDEIQ